MAAAPTLPDARSVPHAVAGLTAPFSQRGAPTLVDRARWWVAPGTLIHAADYLKVRPPRGMELSGTGLAGKGPGSVQRDWVGFGMRGDLQLDFTIVPYQGGVAVRADASTIWVPTRPSWSLINDVTSVDVTVIRHALNPGMGGAPTVHRRLTGAAANRLADEINALPAAAPEGPHGCVRISVEASDLAVFHTAHDDVRISHPNVGCAENATITERGHTKSPALVSGTSVTHALLHALGLPDDYGMR